MTKKTAIITTAVVVVAAAVIILIVTSASEDEAPIIVKNGSMDVLAGDDPANNRHWKWTRATGGNPVFIHEPTHPHGDVKAKQLLVYVMGQPVNGCTTQTAGDIVTIAYDDGFSIKISRVQLGASGNYRLHVESSAPTGLEEVPGAKRPTLRHGVSGSGYIASVTVGSAPACTFPSASALTRICVSPDVPTKACEE